MYGMTDEFIDNQNALANAKARIAELEAELAALKARIAGGVDCNGLDTPEMVRFYEHDFYPLSNFSAFTLQWEWLRFDTSEAAYHWEKFPQSHNADLRAMIRFAPSAHEAFKIAERNKQFRRADWDSVKLDVMRRILQAKVDQHEYVRRKLLATGNRLLIEDSWRDDFWGWGPNRDGQNWLGKLWMEQRAKLIAGQRVTVILSGQDKGEG
jgi:N-glycosidase YbiA